MRCEFKVSDYYDSMKEYEKLHMHEIKDFPHSENYPDSLGFMCIDNRINKRIVVLNPPPILLALNSPTPLPFSMQQYVRLLADLY